MQKTAEALKTLEITLEKYKKNKTLVSPEDLKGKYRAPFRKLKLQLSEALIAFIKEFSFGDLVIRRDDKEKFDALIRKVEEIYKGGKYNARFQRAAFQEYDLQKIIRIAEELRIRIFQEAWIPYFQEYICLFVTKDCVGDHPRTPRIYNSLVDKFFDQEKGEWIENEKSEKPALLIFLGGDNENSNTDTKRI
jgi:hypothetical protein